MTGGGGPVDPGQLRALLVAYWRMTRRGRAAGALVARDARTFGSALPLACGLYGALGAMMGIALVRTSDVLLYGFVLHAFTVFAAGMALTIESGDILFSRVENDVLGHRPIAPATLLLAKGIHLFAFGLLVSGSINAIPAVIGLGLKGARPWFPVAHLLATAGQTAFLCAAVVFVYGAVARLVGRERFESVGTWAQVGTSVLFVLGYQLVPHFIAKLEGAPIPLPLLSLTPPGWFASLGAILGGTGAGPLLPAATGILVTSALSWAAIRHLSAGYAERLVSLAEASIRRKDAADVAVASRRPGTLFRLWMRDPSERAGFSLAAAYMSRDRETKQRLYPSLAGLLVVPVMAFLNPKGPLSGGPVFALFGLGMVALVSVSVTETLRVSSQHAAAEVFRAAPLESAGGLFHGARKAALFYVALPTGLVMAALIAITFQGGRDGLIAGVPLILSIPTVSLIPGVLGDYVPLSRPVVHGDVASRTMILMFGGFLAIGAFAVAGFLAFRANLVLPVAAVEVVVLAVAHAAALKAIRSRPFPED